jgi:hypothetical protein
MSIRASQHSHRQTSRSQTPRFRPGLEPLEERYAPSCTYNSSTHVLTGTGNDAAEFRIAGTTTSLFCNNVLIGTAGSTNVTLTFNGGTGNNSLLLNDSAFGGGDSYHVFPTEIYIASIGFHGKVNSNVQTLSIKTGAGGDLITQSTSFGPGELFAFPKVLVDGGGGSDTFVADDSGQSCNAFCDSQYEVNQAQITSPLGLVATYSNIENVSLKTGAAGDQITVSGPGNTLFSSPKVTVDGGGPGFESINSLILDNSGSPSGATYDVTAGQVSLPNSLGVVATYSNIQLVNLKAGAGNDTVDNVVSAASPALAVDAGGGTANSVTEDLSAGSTGQSYNITESQFGVYLNSEVVLLSYTGVQNLSVLTGSGADYFLVSGSDHTLGLLPHLTLAAGSGANSLEVDNSGQSAGDTYQVSDGAITLPNSLGTIVTYVENGTNFMAHVTLDTGAGNDAVTVFAYGSGIGTDLTVDDFGASTADSLTLDNTANIAGGTYTITSGSIVPPGPIVPVNYLGFENLTLKTGLVLNEGSVVNIESTPSGGTTTVTGGNSNDTLVAGGTTGKLDGIQEPVLLNGGAGTDAVVVNDANSTTNNVYVGSPTAVSKLGGPVVSYATVESVTVNGGSGRDLMIAGTGKMKLVAGGGEDILIGGSTNFDTDPTSLNALMAEWTRTDEVYQQRVRHITRGGGVNGSTKLNPATVHGNGGGNTLLGGSADKDLFFGSKTLDTTDWDSNTESFYSV